jgi:hypothetical protein
MGTSREDDMVIDFWGTISLHKFKNINCELIPKNRDFLEKLVFELVTKFLAIMKSEVSLSCPQGVTSGLHPEPDLSTPCPPTKFV